MLFRSRIVKGRLFRLCTNDLPYRNLAVSRYPRLPPFPSVSLLLLPCQEQHSIVVAIQFVSSSSAFTVMEYKDILPVETADNTRFTCRICQPAFPRHACSYGRLHVLPHAPFRCGTAHASLLRLRQLLVPPRRIRLVLSISFRRGRERHALREAGLRHRTRTLGT